jgi:hypothetical protein
MPDYRALVWIFAVLAGGGLAALAIVNVPGTVAALADAQRLGF